VPEFPAIHSVQDAKKNLPHRAFLPAQIPFKATSESDFNALARLSLKFVWRTNLHLGGVGL
jgi:hypothetical protein